MTSRLPYSPACVSRRLMLSGALGLGATAALSGCGVKDSLEAQGQAFVDPQIPPGLPPEYYPAKGFVWSGLTVGKHPQARYGVGAPPVNPRGHFLVLADAAYPAEVYFDLVRPIYDLGLSVWILEAPGQGGSGRYIFENQHVDIPDYKHATTCAKALISDVIRPEPQKPLYVFGHGSGALTAMQLEGQPIQSLYLYGVWSGPDNTGSEPWSGDTPPTDEWGQIAFRWQKANPDLRLKGVTQGWIKEMEKARKAAMTKGAKIPAVWLEAEADIDKARTMCSQRSACQAVAVKDRDDLKRYLTARIAD
ncbi:MAG: alpha/beta hydrolase [Asticcacaulis sp.]